MNAHEKALNDMAGDWEKDREGLLEQIKILKQQVPESNSVSSIIALKEKYRDYWRDKDDSYWLQRLMQEVGELASVLAGDHDDTAEHELRQISAIAMNWLEMREKQEGAG